MDNVKIKINEILKIYSDDNLILSKSQEKIILDHLDKLNTIIKKAKREEKEKKFINLFKNLSNDIEIHKNNIHTISISLKDEILDNNIDILDSVIYLFNDLNIKV